MPERRLPSQPRPRNHRETLASAIAVLGNAPKEAERLAASVLRAERANVLAAQILGEALLIQGRPAEAVAPLQRAVQRGADATTEVLLARAMLASGREDEATSVLRRACERRPPIVSAFAALGEHLRSRGSLEEAAQVFEGGLALIPEADALRLGLGYVALDRDDRAAARRWFSEASDASVATLAAHGRLAVIEGDFATAVKWYYLALGQQPGSLAVEVNLAICLLETGRRTAGETLLRKVRREIGAPSGRLVAALASASHGRAFLRPSAAEYFLNYQAAAVRP